MDFYKGFPKFAIRGDVDNQIGNLHGKLRRIIRGGFDLEPFDEYHTTILISNNTIPTELAKKVRDFINNIPFDNEIKILNDTDNQPKDFVNKSFDDINEIKLAYEKKKFDPTEWAWEKYNADFWRALPLTCEAFFGSPIIELFDLLEEKWYRTKIPNFDISNYAKVTWVIQRIQKGHGIGLHTDDNPWRKLAFVYYLTADDWDYEKDGGELCICGNNYDEKLNSLEYISINPGFNSMVVWDMVNQKSPLHFVNHVKADDDKPRIALVGFFAN